MNSILTHLPATIIKDQNNRIAYLYDSLGNKKASDSKLHLILQPFSSMVSMKRRNNFGAPVGVGLIITGSATFGFGVATVVNNGKEDIATDMGQAIGRGVDMASENNNHTSEKLGSIVDFGLGIPSGNVGTTGNIISAASTGVSAIGTFQTVSNLSQVEENSTVKSGNKSTDTNNSIKSNQSSSNQVDSEQNYVEIEKTKQIQPINPFLSKQNGEKKLIIGTINNQ